MLCSDTTRFFYPISSRAHDFFVACEKIGFYSVTGMQAAWLAQSFIKLRKV